MAEDMENMGPEDRHGLLLLAAEHGRVAIAEKALEQEQRDTAGDVVALLHKPGPEDAARNAPIHLACQGGHADLVGVFLRRGADPGLRNAAGKSARELSRGIAKEAAVRSVFEMELIRRACSGEFEGVEQLLAAGVDPKCSSVGTRPAELAEKFGHRDVQLRLEAAEQGRSFLRSAAPSEVGEDAARAGPLCSDPTPTPRTSPSRAGASGDLRRLEEAITSASVVAASTFPRAWPPFCSVQMSPPPAVFSMEGRWASLEPARRVDFPLSSLATVEVALPSGVSAERAAALLRPLSEALADAARAVAAVVPDKAALAGSRGSPASSSAARLLPVGPPALCPRFGASAGRHLLFGGGSVAGGAGGEGPPIGASVALVADPRLTLAPGAFRMALRSGSPAPGALGGGGSGGRCDEDGAAEESCGRGGCIEVAAADLPSLRRGLEALRQLLALEAAVDRARRCLVLPACTIEDCPRQGGFAAEEPSSIYLDACALPAQAAAQALASLRRWRVSRIYAPIAAAAQRTGAERAALMQRIFELRCEAEASGVGLVPVVTVAPGEQLAGEAAARDLLEQLSQLGCDGHLGIRCRIDPLPSAASRPDPADGAGAQSSSAPATASAAAVDAELLAGQVLARLHAVYAVAASAFGAQGAVLDLWLPSHAELVMDTVCSAVLSGHFGPGAARLRIFVECLPLNGVAASAAAAEAAAAMVERVSSFGLSCALFVASEGRALTSSSTPSGGVDAAAGAGSTAAAFVPWPPAVVWPEAGVRAKAAALESALRRARAAGSARAAVVEVPVWSAPWLAPAAAPAPGPGQRLAPSAGATPPPLPPVMMCGLTALLAAGLAASSSSSSSPSKSGGAGGRARRRQQGEGAASPAANGAAAEAAAQEAPEQAAPGPAALFGAGECDGLLVSEGGQEDGEARASAPSAAAAAAASAAATGRLLAAQLLGVGAAGAGAAAGADGACAAAAIAEALWDVPQPTASALAPPPPPPSEFMERLLGLLSGRWSPQAQRTEDATGSVSAWYHHLYKRRQHLRSVAGTVAALEESRANGAGGGGLGGWLGIALGEHSELPAPPWLAGARHALQVALTGTEWLLFSCQFYMLLLKHSSGGVQGAQEDLRAAVARVPPAKQCDIQNTFLRVVECTVKQHEHFALGLLPTGPSSTSLGVMEPEDGPIGIPSGVSAEELKALWDSGVRIGAALSLEPWLGFAAAERR